MRRREIVVGHAETLVLSRFLPVPLDDARALDILLHDAVERIDLLLHEQEERIALVDDDHDLDEDDRHGQRGDQAEVDVERQQRRRAGNQEGQAAHDAAQRRTDHRLDLRRVARDARDQRARAERVNLLHRKLQDAPEAVLADVIAEILRAEIDADAAHDTADAADRDNQGHPKARLHHEREVRHTAVMQAQHTLIDDGLHQARLIEVDEDLADHEDDHQHGIVPVWLDIMQHSFS